MLLLLLPAEPSVPAFPFLLASFLNSMADWEPAMVEDLGRTGGGVLPRGGVALSVLFTFRLKVLNTKKEETYPASQDGANYYYIVLITGHAKM